MIFISVICCASILPLPATFGCASFWLFLVATNCAVFIYAARSLMDFNAAL